MMKKISRILAMTLIMALSLSVVAFAVGDVIDAYGAKATLTFETAFAGSEATFSENGEWVDVVVKSNTLKASDGYYLVLALKDEDTIDENSIIYIDQVEAEEGKISFKVYPSVMTSSKIVITGVTAEGTSDGRIRVAVINGKYVIGDANGDGVFDVMDVTRLLRYLAEFTENAEIVAEASDVDGVAGVSVMDVTKMLRVLAEFETF